MKPLVSLTGHISSFFELMRVTQHWAEQRGEEVLATLDSPHVFNEWFPILSLAGLCLWGVAYLKKFCCGKSVSSKHIIACLYYSYPQLIDFYLYSLHEGVNTETAKAYVSSFYASLASSTVSSPSSFEGDDHSRHCIGALVIVECFPRLVMTINNAMLVMIISGMDYALNKGLQYTVKYSIFDYSKSRMMWRVHIPLCSSKMICFPFKLWHKCDDKARDICWKAVTLPV